MRIAQRVLSSPHYTNDFDYCVVESSKREVVYVMFLAFTSDGVEVNAGPG